MVKFVLLKITMTVVPRSGARAECACGYLQGGL